MRASAVRLEYIREGAGKALMGCAKNHTAFAACHEAWLEHAGLACGFVGRVVHPGGHGACILAQLWSWEVTGSGASRTNASLPCCSL